MWPVSPLNAPIPVAVVAVDKCDICSGHGLEGEYRVFRERVRKNNRLVIYKGHFHG